MVIAPAAAVAHESRLDSFIGTLSIERGEVISTRCDLGNSRYVLRDATGAQAVTRYRAYGKPAYADVMASYSDEGSRNSCHLRDALDALSQPGAANLKEAPANRPIAGSSATQGTLVGHYYLTGVMETGSELLLRPDGLFDWSLSYGTVDQEAQGAWHVERDEVVLVTSAPSARAPLFSYLSTGPWTVEAERERGERKRSAIEAAVRVRCPIFPEPQVMTTSLTLGEAAAAPILQERAATALRAATASRTTVETLAARLMSVPAASGTKLPGADEVRQSMSDWLVARNAALQAAHDAGMVTPALTDPVLPAACTMPADEPITDKPGALPPGLGIQILDPESGHPARGITVAVRFADGAEQQLVTDAEGFALASGDATANAVGATMQAKASSGGDADANRDQRGLMVDRHKRH
ncbi:hypothetical protein [Sphingomonas sp. PB4P5]|uniref:hypothetical protein n=1 Tax=Parasphingomonas puruogangriensis TaxID=3096155 RepID=UPI002FCA5CF9